jgi:hypothetical protein
MVTNSIIVLIQYCIHVVYILYLCCTHIYFQHRICIACALLNVGDATLQQHSYKLHIQY